MLETLHPQIIFYIILILTFAGFVKGVVGFAFPMIAFSFLSLVFSPENTIATLIFPTIIMNFFQFFSSKKRFNDIKINKILIFTIILVLTLIFTSQIYYFLPIDFIIYSMACFIIIFSILPNISFSLSLESRYFKIFRLFIALISGFFGGISGIWGPPTVIYLLILKLKKNEFILLQSVIFLLGSISLIIGHYFSGLIKIQTSIISILFIIPSFIGFFLGVFLRKRINTVIFFKVVKLILFFSGLAMIVNSFLN